VEAIMAKSRRDPDAYQREADRLLEKMAAKLRTEFPQQSRMLDGARHTYSMAFGLMKTSSFDAGELEDGIEAYDRLEQQFCEQKTALEANLVELKNMFAEIEERQQGIDTIIQDKEDEIALLHEEIGRLTKQQQETEDAKKVLEQANEELRRSRSFPTAMQGAHSIQTGNRQLSAVYDKLQRVQERLVNLLQRRPHQDGDVSEHLTESPSPGVTLQSIEAKADQILRCCDARGSLPSGAPQPQCQTGGPPVAVSRMLRLGKQPERQEGKQHAGFGQMSIPSD
jgi:DNA repair exonuclease SbcCD ATPase subunit